MSSERRHERQQHAADGEKGRIGHLDPPGQRRQRHRAKQQTDQPFECRQTMRPRRRARTPSIVACDSTAIRSALASPERYLQDKPMRRRLTSSIRNAALASMLWIGLTRGALAAGADPAPAPPPDPAPSVAAIAANDDDKIVAACGELADNDK